MNSVINPQIALDDVSSQKQEMSRSRLVRAYLIDTKYEFVRMLRNPPFIIPILIIPVVMYLIFGVVFINSFDEKTWVDISKADIMKMMYVNFSVFSVLGPAMVSLGTHLALERDAGLLTFKRALPMPALAPLLAKALFAMLLICTLELAITTEAIVFGKLDLTFGEYAGVWAVCLLGSLPFAAIGLFMGASMSGNAANGMVTGAYMTMAMLGGLLFPLPPNFAWVALFSPPFYLSQLGFGAAGMNTMFDPAFPLALLFALGIVFTWLAARRITRS
jgi:ABC-2 type transport system permease protein